MTFRFFDSTKIYRLIWINVLIKELGKTIYGKP
jgi:hypothetical protein